MTESKLEEASRCPKCQNPGNFVLSKPGPQRSTVQFYECTSSLCPWYQTRWIVQVRADGTIPDPADRLNPADKLYKPIPEGERIAKLMQERNEKLMERGEA